MSPTLSLSSLKFRSVSAAGLALANSEFFRCSTVKDQSSGAGGTSVPIQCLNIAAPANDAEPSALNRLAEKRLLVWGEWYFHTSHPTEKPQVKHILRVTSKLGPEWSAGACSCFLGRQVAARPLRACEQARPERQQAVAFHNGFSTRYPVFFATVVFSSCERLNSRQASSLRPSLSKARPNSK